MEYASTMYLSSIKNAFAYGVKEYTKSCTYFMEYTPTIYLSNIKDAFRYGLRKIHKDQIELKGLL